MDDFVPLDPFSILRRCISTSSVYSLSGEDIRCRRISGHGGDHQADVSPHSRDRNIVSWAKENGS